MGTEVTYKWHKCDMLWAQKGHVWGNRGDMLWVLR